MRAVLALTSRQLVLSAHAMMHLHYICTCMQIARRSTLQTLQVGNAGEFGRQHPIERTSGLALAATQPPDACKHLSAGTQVSGSIALAQRGNCSFADKAKHAAAAGIEGLIIVNNSTDCLGSPASTNDSAAETLSSLWVASADGATGALLFEAAMQYGPDIEVAVRSVLPRRLDGASAVLWLMAVCTILAGSLWSGSTFRAHLAKQRSAHVRHSESLDAGAGADDEGARFELRIVHRALCHCA